jgi:hypothetical protein
VKSRILAETPTSQVGEVTRASIPMLLAGRVPGETWAGWCGWMSILSGDRDIEGRFSLPN